MELEQELRSTSDELLRRLERLRELEVEKRNLKPGTEHFRAIARDIEMLAAGVLTKTVEQEQLADESLELRRATGSAAPPIVDVPPVREPSAILAEWREAERRLADAPAGTIEHDEARAEVDRLRDEYRRAYRAASSEHGPD
jgi:hypothetical protein